MKEREFRVLIKHYFLGKKTITKTKKKFDKHEDWARSISVVVPALMMPNVQVPQNK